MRTPARRMSSLSFGKYRMAAGLLLLAAATTGCGSGAKTTAAPSLSEAIRSFREIAEAECERMLAAPAGAANSLAVFKEGIEARSRDYGEPFTSYLATASEIEASWAGKPSAAAVKQGVAALREALTRLDQSQKR